MSNELGVLIDPQQLEAIVATALDEPAARLGAWQVEPLHGSYDPRHRLLRLAGHAHTPAGDRTWSLVLKIVKGGVPGEEHAEGWHFWKREVFFYQSGLADDLPGSLIAPRCYQTTQCGDDYWLWLEEVHDELGKPWPLEHYPKVTRCLGRFNGAYLAGELLPQEPWFSRHCLRDYVEIAAPTIHDLPALRKLWYFQRSFPILSDDLVLEAWERRADFLGALEQMPQTFCHQDAFEGNLFWRRGVIGQGQLVAIDWSFAGSAAVGEEIAPLMTMAGLDLITGAADFMQFYEACLEGYLAGLAEAGFSADPQQARFSSLTAVFYRGLFGAVLGELWSALRDERSHPTVLAMLGAPSLDFLLDRLAQANHMLLAAYEEIIPLLKYYS